MSEVRDIVGRWNEDTFFTLVRNKVCFHIDAEVLERGLERLAASQMNVVLLESEGEGMGFQRMRLAHEFLNTGLFTTADADTDVALDQATKGQDRVEEFG